VEVKAAAFSPDGKTVLTGSTDRSVRLWDAETGALRWNLRGRHAVEVTCVAFSPDGLHFASGGFDGVAQLWDAKKGDLVGFPMRHRGPVRAVAFDPEGTLLVTASLLREYIEESKRWVATTGEVRLWDREGRPLGKAIPHPEPVWSVALAPKGQRLLATGCEDGGLRLFPTTGSAVPVARLQPQVGTVRQVAFSPDGSRLLAAADGGDDLTGASAGLWRVPGELTGFCLFQDRGGVVRCLNFSPDGKHLLVGFGPDGRLLTNDSPGKSCQARLLDAQTGRDLLGRLDHPGTVYQVAFSPDGRLLATRCRDGLLRLWDRQSGQLLRQWRHKDVALDTFAFSPDGRVLAVSGKDRTIRLWRVEDGSLIGKPLEHPAYVWTLCFTPDGRGLWSTTNDHTARCWDLGTGTVARSWTAPGQLTSAALRPEGRTLLSAASAGWLIQQRDLLSGQPEGPALGHPAAIITGLAFSDDGSLALSGGGRAALLWDLATGRRIGPALEFQDAVHAVAFQPGGKVFAVGGACPLQTHGVPQPLAGSPEEIQLRVELLTGQRRDPVGVIHNLTPAEMEARRAQLRVRPGGR
jgi:WD40 repeat protein